MAKLVLSFDGKIIKDYEIDKEIVTIGRKTNNDIYLDNLAVSGSHAKILTILNDSFIEDLDSTNGTYVEGNKITKHALQNGEIIIIGKHELKYFDTSAGTDELAFENTMIIRPDEQMQQETEERDMGSDREGDRENENSISRIANELASASSHSSEPGAAKLQLISGANAGKELQLTKILTTLGKPGVQIAAITRRTAGYFIIIVDSGKDNKMPMVNGEEVGKQHPLSDGDIIEVAGVEMRFNLMQKTED